MRECVDRALCGMPVQSGRWWMGLHDFGHARRSNISTVITRRGISHPKPAPDSAIGTRPLHCESLWPRIDETPGRISVAPGVRWEVAAGWLVRNGGRSWVELGSAPGCRRSPWTLKTRLENERGYSF